MLLDSGARVNDRAGELDSALHAACLFGHEKVVQTLLEAGADVNAKVGSCDSALQAALLRIGNSERVIKMLIDAVANIDVDDMDLNNELQAESSESGKMDMVKMLLNARANSSAE